jgi:hypothetical protein
MRFHGIAICTLTLLITGGLKAQASDNPNSEGSVQEVVTLENPVVTPAAKLIESSAASETREEQPIIQAAAAQSEQETGLESSAQLPAQGQVEKLAKAPAQTNLAHDSEAQAFQSDRTLTASSAPSSNQPTSEQVPSKDASVLLGNVGEGKTISSAAALRLDEPTPQSSTPKTNQLMADAAPASAGTCIAQAMVGSGTNQLAQGTTGARCPRPQAIPRLAVPEPIEESGASPALSIYIPVGYGADKNTLFLTGSYQNTVREDDGSVGAGGIGIGLGDADKAVGVELSYALETTDNDFGEGGFNAKLHRRLGQDLSAAIGWNGFLNIGRNDFEQSKYGVITKVFRTQDSLNDPFSRVAVTVGVGDGQFRSSGAEAAEENNVNVFGNVAVRVARPVSFIAEWTGRDLGLGLSIAPFKNIPFVITPAVRDVVGAGDGARFVLGAGTAIRF